MDVKLLNIVAHTQLFLVTFILVTIVLRKTFVGL
jgi:hypothetical protein